MHRSPKAQLSEILFQSKLLDYMQLGAGGSLIVFNYHRIRPDGEFSTLFHDEVFGPAVSVFARQIAWLARHTKIVAEAELLEALQSGKPLAGRCSMITFDDGYRDNYALAFPILERYRAPAVFFIPSGIIASRQLGWWDIISYFVKKAAMPQIEVDGISYDLNDARSQTISALIGRMVREPHASTSGLLDRLSKACEVDYPSTETQSAELMSWDEIRRVSQSVVTIGSHTHTHTVLSTLDRKGQMAELETSKQMLEQQLGRRMFSIAYPVGGYAHFTAETKELARDCGYSAGYSFATGVNAWGALDAFDLRRVSSPLTVAFLAAKASLPRFFAGS